MLDVKTNIRYVEAQITNIVNTVIHLYCPRNNHVWHQDVRPEEGQQNEHL